MKWFDDITETVEIAELALYGVTAVVVVMIVVIFYFADYIR